MQCLSKVVLAPALFAGVLMSSGLRAEEAQPQPGPANEEVARILGAFEQQMGGVSDQLRTQLSQANLERQRSLLAAEASRQASVQRAEQKFQRVTQPALEAWLSQQRLGNKQALESFDELIEKGEQAGDLEAAQAAREARQAFVERSLRDAEVTRKQVAAVSETSEQKASSTPAHPVLLAPVAVPVRESGNVAAAKNGAVAYATTPLVVHGTGTQRDHAAFPHPGRLLLELPKVYELQRIRVRLYDFDSRVYTYRIETSTDGETWTPIGGERRGRGWQEITFRPRPARYVRLIGLNNTRNGGFHVLAMEAYCESDHEG